MNTVYVKIRKSCLIDHSWLQIYGSAEYGSKATHTHTHTACFVSLFSRGSESNPPQNQFPFKESFGHKGLSQDIIERRLQEGLWERNFVVFFSIKKGAEVMSVCGNHSFHWKSAYYSNQRVKLHLGSH